MIHKSPFSTRALGEITPSDSCIYSYWLFFLLKHIWNTAVRLQAEHCPVEIRQGFCVSSWGANLDGLRGDSDSGRLVGMSASRDSGRRSSLNLGRAYCKRWRLCLHLPRGQLCSPSCLTASQVASPQNYLLATFIPGCSIKENPREIVWIFHFHSEHHSLSLVHCKFV